MAENSYVEDSEEDDVEEGPMIEEIITKKIDEGVEKFYIKWEGCVTRHLLYSSFLGFCL